MDREMTAEQAEDIAEKLLAWYGANKRDLPWRYTSDPYAIWISEIMAQQTRITALLPYYRRFMARFPTVKDLAGAGEDEVITLWQGLGYYARARLLLSAARKIMERYGGRFPDNYEDILGLPGIGEYTAGAIRSIAFGIPTPAVDGNVLRVMARITGDPTDITTPKAKTTARRFVAQMMPPDYADSFTQALMELGALVCKPGTPDCGSCPLTERCRAFADGMQRSFPVKSAPKPKREVPVTVLIIINRRGEILMRKRTEKLLNGLYEFFLLEERLKSEEIVARLNAMGFQTKFVEPIGEVTHGFTHRIWQMSGFRCDVDEGKAPDGYTFFALSQIVELAMPSALRYFTKQLMEELHTAQ